MDSSRLRLVAYVAATLLAAVPTARAAEPPIGDTIERARTIRAAVTASYRGPHGLVVSDAAPTGSIESFTLLTPPTWDARVVPAANGVYYAICPVGASCPYPLRRHALPADALQPRRQALELALRTFAATPADLVVVSLPTRRFVLLVFERDVVELAAGASLTPRALDALARPRTYVPLGIEWTATGGQTMVAAPRWG